MTPRTVRARRVRLMAALAIELAGLGLIVYACALIATWLGFLVAGLIAIGVAVYIGPSEPESPVRDDDSSSE